MSRGTLCGLSAALCLLVLAVPAVAAPPSNDERTSPQPLTLPASVGGTTQQATLESDEPSSCEGLKASVWYSVTAASADRIVVRLAAAGNLDAVVDVFRRARSQLSGVDCDATDEQGKAELAFRPEPAVTYLIRVGQRANSVAGDFRLDVFAPQPPPRPPGRALPKRGASRTLDAVQDTADAWSVRMRAGVSYRINLSQPLDGCVSVALYPPGTSDFDSDSSVRYRRCGGYTVFTPAAGAGGRYSLLVTAQQRRRGPQRYPLEVARAGRDDIAPGLPLANYRRVRGHLNGGRIDVVDLYRFSLARRSDVQLTLGGAPFGLRVLSDRGRGVGRGEGELEQELGAGRYFVAVIASES